LTRTAPASLAFAAFLATWPLPASAQPSDPDLPQEARDLLSAEYRACLFSEDSPLDASRYPCLDNEYRRLDAMLTHEYRAALARQPDEAGRQRIERLERQWWRTRFAACDDAAADLGGSTAAVIHEACEIHVLAERILWLQRYRP